MSSRRGLPVDRKMRHDRHFVDELANHSHIGVGQMVRLDQIETNREQPRSALGDIAELAESIRRRGVLEPLIVRRTGTNRYQLIAGERRFHAALEAGLVDVPCIEMEVSDQEALELALVENLQRKDLTPFEEAEGYRTLVEKYGYTHEQVAEAVGKSRPTVTETLSLLKIPGAIREVCRHADITAKSVLLLIARAETPEAMTALLEELGRGGLDREALRSALRDHRGGNDLAGESAEKGRSPAGFRPVQLRFRSTPDAPVHLSMSVRRPDVSKSDLIAALQEFLDRLRAGELDDKLESAKKPAKHT
ncbi:MAG: parB 1 [Acidobacteria bacterium]|nr:parB 1 [Acidobacteriota bacterium]